MPNVSLGSVAGQDLHCTDPPSAGSPQLTDTRIRRLRRPGFPGDSIHLEDGVMIKMTRYPTEDRERAKNVRVYAT